MTLTRIHTFDDAIQIARNLAIPVRTELIPSDEAVGRTTVVPVAARLPSPPFRRAMMDGFAISGAHVTHTGQRVLIVGTVFAGNDSGAPCPEPGQAVRIMTGAPLPPGTDTVVRKEWCEEISSEEMAVLRPVEIGESVQQTGEEGKPGDIVSSTGTVVTTRTLAVWRTFGVNMVTVSVRPRVAILVTGDELVRDFRAPLGGAQIYGLNDILLRGALEEDGADVVLCDYVPDNIEQIKQSVRRALDLQADYILLTGGVSMGDYDFVPRVLCELGARLHLERIWMRPGSPFIGATLGSVVAFGMSGNPAACYLQFETIVRPVIRATLGRPDVAFPYTGRLAHDVSLKRIKDVRLLRGLATIEGGVVQVDVQVPQSSSVISSLARANCVVRIDENTLPAGSVVPLRWLSPCH